MLLMLCLATAKKLGHQVSLSLECKGLHSRMEYRKKPVLPKYSINFIKLPAPLTNEDMGALFLDPEKYGDTFEISLREFYAQIFDKSFDTSTTNLEYENFRNNIQILFDLMDDQKHSKSGNRSFAHKNSRKDAFLDATAALALYNLPFTSKTPGRLMLEQDRTYMKGPHGCNVWARVMDEDVFESAEKIKIVIGPRQNISSGHFENFKLATNVNDLNLSADFLTRAGIVAQKTGSQKEVELIVVGAPGISEAAIRKKVDDIMQSADYGAAVESAARRETNVATMGSVGMSAAYHYYIRDFIFTVRSAIDHTWGRFCQTIPPGTNAEINPSLGFGFAFGAGVDYRWTDNIAVGLEGGLRFNQLKIPEIKDPTQKTSTWFTAPYAQVNFTFFGDEDTSLGLFSGYVFAKEFTIKSTGTRVPYGSPCKISGIYGGVRLSRYV